MEIAAATANPFTTSERAAPKKELGKDDFLRLLTTQLSNQDPLKPVDNQEFIAQLAQFASVEQLNKVSTNLESLLVAQTSTNQLAAAGLVGKDVSYRSDGVELAAAGAAKLSTTLEQAAAVTLSIQDSAGRTVRTLALGNKDAGALEIEWDGCDANGARLAPGHYRVVAAGTGRDGTPVAIDLRAKGRVTGAAFGEAGTELLVGSAHVKLSDVLQITQG